MDPGVVREQLAWHSAESLEYYRRHRQTADDLYPSEKLFLPDVVRQVDSMLDVGCAAGGFSAIVREYNPRIRYVGVDIVSAFVEAARADHPDVEFMVGDGLHFKTPPASFELAHAAGVLHLNHRYREMIVAMWEQSARFLMVDLRLSRGPGEVGRMEAPFGERESIPLPYIVLNVQQAISMFEDLRPSPSSIRIKGYSHRPAASAHLRDPQLMMAVIVAEKGTCDADRRLDIDLDVR